MKNDIKEGILKGDLKVINEAIDNGYDFNILDEYGRTILYDLIVDGYEEAVELVSSSNVNLVNTKDKEGKSPLHLAVIHFKINIVNKLIFLGAEIDSKDLNGNTPLSDAVFYSEGKPDVILILMKNHANPDIENEYGMSPRELAESISNFDVTEFLKIPSWREQR